MYLSAAGIVAFVGGMCLEGIAQAKEDRIDWGDLLGPFLGMTFLAALCGLIIWWLY